MKFDEWASDLAELKDKDGIVKPENLARYNTTVAEIQGDMPKLMDSLKQELMKPDVALHMKDGATWDGWAKIVTSVVGP